MVSRRDQDRKPQRRPPVGLFTELPPTLVPRLGEYLVHMGLIRPEDLQRALAYQAKKSTPEKPIPLGQALLELRLIERNVLDRAIYRQSLTLQAALEEANRTLEERIQQRTQDLEKRLLEIRTAAEITQLAISANSQQELLKQVVALLVERFGFYVVSVFVLNESGSKAVLIDGAGKAAAGFLMQEIKEGGFHLPVDSRSTVGVAILQNQVQVLADVSDAFRFFPAELLPGAYSEISIPISTRDRVWGVLCIQQPSGESAATHHPFDQDRIAILRAIANHLAVVLRNFDLSEEMRTKDEDAMNLSQISHQIVEAESANDTFNFIAQAVYLSEYPSLVLATDGNLLRPVAIYSGEGIYKMARKVDVKGIQLQSTRQDFEAHLAVDSPLTICGFDQVEIPACLTEIPFQLDWNSAAYIPIWQQSRLEALIVFGSPRKEMFTPASLQSYTNLAQLTSTALKKLSEYRKMERRLDMLQTLNTVSQAVTVETDIENLYRMIHREVTRLMGEVDFLIASYDPADNTIRIPYMYEGGAYLKYEPFPLGEGLTSILIRTRQPLMIVEDTETRARELGAKVLGRPARSWLGVPLIVAGEVLGAMIVQDLEHEHRFTEEDQRMLSTLASQVAVAIRNAKLMESLQTQAERERLLFEITSKILAASNMETILETTAMELRKALNARRATIEIGVNED